MGVVDARFAVAYADFSQQAACAVRCAQFVAVVFDVACIGSFFKCRAVAVLRIGDGIADFLPELAAVCGKRTVVVVEADFGIARAFGYCAVCNGNDASAAVGQQCVVQARAAAGVVVTCAEAQVFDRLVNYAQTRVDFAV